jgi:hypothetical protein
MQSWKDLLKMTNRPALDAINGGTLKEEYAAF